MQRFLLFSALTLASCVSYAQSNVYVVRNTSPQKTSVVANVDRIDFNGDKATLTSGNKQTAFSTTEVKAMGMKEKDEVGPTIIPASFLSDFDYDISFSASDAALASNSETEVTDASAATYDDFVSHSTWSKAITITYGGSAATVDGTVDGVTVTVNGNHVTVNSQIKELQITLKGTSTDGSFKLYATNKTKVTLDGVTLHNPTGPALNSQSKKRIFIVLNDGTVNTLTDGTTYTKVTGEDQRGCVFSEGKMCISGGGQLTVTGSKKNGIASDDYVHILSGFVKVTTTAEKGTGMKVKDDFIMGGGALQVLTQGEAAKAIASDSLVNISGGKITAIVTGDGLWDATEQDYSTACCLKSDYAMNLTGGDINLLATGLGGKGIRAGSNKQKGGLHDLVVDGSIIHVRTAGDLMPAGATESTKVKSSPKGIKGSCDVNIKSGEVYVRCAGGYGGEGIEAKNDINIYGGKVRSYGYDDGVNAVNSKINGGDIFVCSTDNDGYDCNGGLYINGGTLYAIGAPGVQAGIDNDGKTFAMNGGTVVAVGGYMSTPWNSKSKQSTVLVGLKKNASYLALTDTDGNNIVTAKIPSVYNPINVMISSNKIETGKSYKILTFNNLVSGEEKGGIIDNAVYSNATTEFEFTTTELLTKLGSVK